MNDRKIAEVLAKFGEPLAGNVWRVQGNAVIYHKALERIADAAGITFDQPTVIRAERDECVLLVTGHIMRDRMVDKVGEIEVYREVPTRSAWSIGEALVGVNYRVSGKQAAYVYAMAEKRAKDRVILKLIELAGEVYSSDEADEFKQQNAEPERKRETADIAKMSTAEKLVHNITRRDTWEKVQEYMLQPAITAALAGLDEEDRDWVRAEAKDRMLALGWRPQAKAEAGRTPVSKDPTSRGPGIDEHWAKQLDRLRDAVGKVSTEDGVEVVATDLEATEFADAEPAVMMHFAQIVRERKEALRRGR